MLWDAKKTRRGVLTGVATFASNPLKPALSLRLRSLDSVSRARARETNAESQTHALEIATQAFSATSPSACSAAMRSPAHEHAGSMIASRESAQTAR